MYLALDQSPARVGFAYGAVTMSKPASGVYRLDKSLMEASLRDWLQAMIILRGIQRVVYEEPFVGPKMRQDILMRMLALPAIIKLVCHDCGLSNPLAAPQGTWRKHFLGVGRAPNKTEKARQWLKDEAMRACAERCWYVDSDDEAEACGILDWALSKESCTICANNAGLLRRMEP